MGSPVTFSGFNQIDFGVVLNAIMQQESQPLTALQSQQSALKATDSAFAQLATRLNALQSAASDLSGTTATEQYSGSSSDAQAVSVSASGESIPGRYEIIVNELARAQVLVANASVADSDSTIVASGGSLTIGGVDLVVTGPVTLQQLAAQINAVADVPVTAAVVETAPGAFRLLLTGKNTGTANAFTVANGLVDTLVTFADGDDNGISGDTTGDNAVQATDASVMINNIPVTSSDNTLANAIPGATITLLQKDPSKTVVVTVDHTEDALIERVRTFVSAYNDLTKFADDQAAASGEGTPGALGRDALVRNLRQAMRSAMSAAYGNGTFTRLAEIGLGFNRAGQLTLDQTALSTAARDNPAAIEQLLDGGGTGAFASIKTLLTSYTQSGGFVAGARSRVSDELSRLGRRIDDMQARLAIRRAALQQEFIAADRAMSRLNGQMGALASFGTSLINGAP